MLNELCYSTFLPRSNFKHQTYCVFIVILASIYLAGIIKLDFGSHWLCYGANESCLVQWPARGQGDISSGFRARGTPPNCGNSRNPNNKIGLWQVLGSSRRGLALSQLLATSNYYSLPYKALITTMGAHTERWGAAEEVKGFLFIMYCAGLWMWLRTWHTSSHPWDERSKSQSFREPWWGSVDTETQPVSRRKHRPSHLNQNARQSQNNTTKEILYNSKAKTDDEGHLWQYTHIRHCLHHFMKDY